MTLKSTLGERLYELIRQDIFAGKYKPGERLFFETIARDTGMSMTPIKEAFMLLEREGLVVTRARKGTFVREWTTRDLVEHTQIRLALELLAAELVCQKGLSDEHEEAFRTICDGLAEHIRAGDAKGCVSDDVLYHRRLVLASGNAQLIHLIETLPFTNLLNLAERAQHYLEHGDYFLAEHRKILEMLERKDIESLRKMLVHHIGGQYSNLAVFDSQFSEESEPT